MAQRRPGRPTKYNWENKRDICYRLYIEENRSLKEVIDLFTTAYISDGPAPTARDFQRQFRRWQFPKRKHSLSSDDEALLLERLRQLWDTNLDQKQMTNVLVEEGWQLDSTSLARLRRKHGLVLRVAKGFDRSNMGPGTGKKRKYDVLVEAQPEEMQLPESTIPDDEAARRAQRLLELQVTSDARLTTGKRRRRIRGLAHLPPDAPGLPPRYKSETSLDECKAFLQLSNNVYTDIRQKFGSICVEMGITKKTLCAEGQWQAAKTRLIRESVHLLAILNPVHGDISKRENALEVICNDITKRMRNAQTRISLKDANSILGLNPEASKELRRQFYDILKADHFQSKLLCGPEHWEELKQQWLSSSDIAQQLHAAGLDDQSKRSIDVLLRDAMKRHNDDHAQKSAHLTQQNSHGPGPGPARSRAVATIAAIPPISGPPVDPALYAALTADIVPTTQVSNKVAAYFRLSPSSQMIGHPAIWLASLAAPNMHALHAAAVSKSPTANLLQVCGIIKGSDGQEDSYQIDNDEEVMAYLDAAGSKPVFNVVLQT